MNSRRNTDMQTATEIILHYQLQLLQKQLQKSTINGYWTSYNHSPLNLLMSLCTATFQHLRLRIQTYYQHLSSAILNGVNRILLYTKLICNTTDWLKFCIVFLKQIQTINSSAFFLLAGQVKEKKSSYIGLGFLSTLTM